ncbi:MAG: M48 family metallopeptidase [Clostridia bacterium]|nr:M48 family metallopeptidase [Clostridia bacterium]
MEKESVDINGEKLVFFIQRKNVKNINLRVNLDKKVTISIPMKMEIEIAKEFVKKKAEWIKKQQNYYELFTEEKENITFENGETVYLLGKQYKMKIIPYSKNDIIIKGKYFEIYIKEKFIENKKYIRKEYDKWLKEYAENMLTDVVSKYQTVLEKYSIKMPEIEIRQMKNRWGSCLPSNNKVSFNLNLIKTPICCIEYVVLHELSHFKYPNHSKNFYNFVTVFMPDWNIRKKILDEEFMGVV